MDGASKPGVSVSAAPMQVSVVPAGSMLIDHSQLYWNHNPGVSIRHPVYSVLIEHPEGRVLIDTGFDLSHVGSVLPFVEPQHDIGGPLTAGLRAAGARPEEIRYLIHTHLHFDHVGGDSELTEATVFVHREELRQARDPESFEALSYSDQRFFARGARVELIESDTEVLPGITMLQTPGHSAGHCSILLSGASGQTLLLCGDATYTRGNLERAIISGFHLDPVASVRSITRLQRLAREHDAMLWFPHDAEEFPSYPQAGNRLSL
jgi:4-pyridoxolactonase